MLNVELKYNTVSLRSLSQLFTPTTFSKIVRKKEYSIVDSRLKKHITNTKGLTRINLIKTIYSKLEKQYKSEYLYKNTLINKLLLGRYSLNTTTIINELKIKNSIADFVLLNGEIRIFEIKTELDGLQKLSKQINDYKTFANKIFIVTNSKYVNSLSKLYQNDTIGIIEYTKKKTLKEIKPAIEDSKHLDYEVLFKSLRKNEYLELINSYFGFIPNVPNTLIFKESLKMVKTIEISVFQKLVLKQLKKRKIKFPDLLKSTQTPDELKYLCYTLNFNRKEYLTLYEFLNKKI